MALYLAEQYWPYVSHQLLRAAVDNLSVKDGVAEMPGRVVAVLFTPDDECVFYLVDGQSERAVAAVVARTGRPANSVQRCERLDGGPTAPSGASLSGPVVR